MQPSETNCIFALKKSCRLLRCLLRQFYLCRLYSSVVAAVGSGNNDRRPTLMQRTRLTVVRIAARRGARSVWETSVSLKRIFVALPFF